MHPGIPLKKDGSPVLKPESVFLSYNAGDKAYARKLAAAFALAGAHVWFDEWIVRPGDSIPNAIEQGLAGFTSFALVWSKSASDSRWVKTEMESAITRWLKEKAIRVVPIILDRTPLPLLLQPVRYIDGSDGDPIRVARSLLGLESDAAFRWAVQSVIDESGIEFRAFWGMGLMVACPKCGASANNLEGWQAVDHSRDDTYVGARCKLCGWNDGSEL